MITDHITYHVITSHVFEYHVTHILSSHLITSNQITYHVITYHISSNIMSYYVITAEALALLRAHLPPNAILVGQSILKDVQWLQLAVMT